MTPPERSRPPRADEIEISLFGPGCGESLVLHLGHGDWMIVDSCIDNVSAGPASLRYLRDLGIDPARQVKWILTTHWHDDHIRGLSATLRLCEGPNLPAPLHSGEQSSYDSSRHSNAVP